MQAALFSTSSWRGSLDLRYVFKGNQTQLNYAQAKAPFKIQRSFYPEGDAVCHSVILHTAGGLVGGDQLVASLQLAPHAQVLVTTGAASKIYRSNGLITQQKIRISVAEGACLEWFPQEAIVFQGANYQQDIRIDLEPGASVLLWEMMRFGRTASGESFRQGHVRSQIEVWQGGKPLWIDRQQLLGNETFLQAPNAFAGAPVLGCFAWLGRDVSSDLLETIRALDLDNGQAAKWGVTRLTAGLLGRYRGTSTLQARQGFMAFWNLIRQESYLRSACIPRVWPS